MTNNYDYWLSILIGFLIVLFIYKYKPFGIERFDSAIDVTSIGNLMNEPLVPPVQGVPQGSIMVTTNGKNPLTKKTTSGTPSGESASAPGLSPASPDSSGSFAPSPSKSFGPSSIQSYSSPISLGPSYLGPATSVSTDGLPFVKNALLYFNSFNSKPSSSLVTNINRTFQCATNFWCDAINSSIKYFLNGPNVPATIDNSGLYMKQILIQGPPTYSLSSASDNYHLESFTVAFYLNFNSVSFDTDADIRLFEMFAQTPNLIRISFVPIQNDKENIELNVYVGPSNIIYSWVVPITTILSNGNTTLYSLVYDTDTAILTFYIGLGKNVYTATVVNTPTIVLGPQQLQLNTNRNLDASISAFCYYNIALSRNDMNKLNDYFVQEAASLNVMQKTLDAVKDSLSDQNRNLQKQLNSTTQEVTGCMADNDALRHAPCPVMAPIDIAPPPSGPMWQINMNGNTSVTDADLDKCSPLKVTDYILPNSTAPIPNIQSTANIVNMSVFAGQPSASPSPGFSASPVSQPSNWNSMLNLFNS